MKSIVMAVGTLIVLLIAGALIYYRIRTSHRSEYTPIESGEVFEGIHVIRDDFINFWLFETKAGLVAFDQARNADVIRAEMKKLDLDPQQVVAVFLTHTDAEHAGALKLFPNAKVYMAREEVQMVDGTTVRAARFLRNKISVPYTTLADGQDLEVCGLKVHCILVPGHTPGSMAYVVNGSMLFPGDAFNMDDGRVVLFEYPFVNMDPERQKTSISKLSRLPGIEYILTTHYGYSDDFQRAFEGWRCD